LAPAGIGVGREPDLLSEGLPQSLQSRPPDLPQAVAGPFEQGHPFLPPLMLLDLLLPDLLELLLGPLELLFDAGQELLDVALHGVISLRWSHSWTRQRRARDDSGQ